MRSSWLGVIGWVLAGVAATSAAPAFAGDPFEDARYYITIDDARVLALVDSGQVSVSDTNQEGYTLLHYAADANRLQLVQALLQRGADPRARSARGSTPYDMASQSSVKVTLARAAAGNAPAVSSGTGDRPAMANAPATIVSQGGSDTTQRNGICAAVRAEPVNNGRSIATRPILRARDDIWYNKPEELTALLDHCVRANAKDPNGSTLLHTAAERDRVDAARILLAHGADRTLTDAQGKTAAAYATSAEMRALLGTVPVAGSKSSTLRTECQQKYQADLGLAYDQTMRTRAQNKWSRCLATGRYQ